jgi:hypothetical protein
MANRTQHHTNVLPSFGDIHAPHADRFEPREETWLYVEDAKAALPASVAGCPEAVMEGLEGLPRHVSERCRSNRSHDRLNVCSSRDQLLLRPNRRTNLPTPPTAHL